MQFSERIGLVKRTVQFQTMSERLRNRLWNVAYEIYWRDLDSKTHTRRHYRGELLMDLGLDFFAIPEDEIHILALNAYTQIKQFAFGLDWAHFYDLIEFIGNAPSTKRNGHQDSFIKRYNAILKEELAGYRFVGLELAPITNDEEIATVENAMSQAGQFAPASTHISTALARLADRPQPDSRNCIKEAISGVEAVCQTITGDRKAALGEALKKIAIHPALERGFKAIYGYTSDAHGIRHALSDEPTVDVDDARFFLVSCSAFINYLIAKSTGSLSSEASRTS